MSRTTRELTSRTTLETLRQQAKRWLKDIQSGEPLAVERIRAVFPDEPNPALRQVQHALAHEFGFASWAALKQEIEDRQRTHADRVRLFLEKSAIRYSTAPGSQEWNTYEPDRPSRGVFAARLLERDPDIAYDSIHTAVAAGDITHVRKLLAKDPSLASQRGEPDSWPPLLRLAYTRLPVEAASTYAVAIATLLLDNGASPVAGWTDSRNDFNVVTGVIGHGEGGAPPHPQAEALVRLLLARGADWMNGQALYNTSLGEDDTFWLDLLWQESERRNESARWREPVAELMGPPVDYLLGNAVPHHPRRAAWLLAHGARADANNAYSKRPVVKHAAEAGKQDLVALLVQHGATRPVLTGAEAFVAAATQGDTDAVRRLASENPTYLRDPAAMFAAIHARRAGMIELLLDLGMSPDIGDDMNLRALHVAADIDAVAIGALLIARGAAIDPVERRYNSTPLGHANFNGSPGMLALLSPLSRDIRGLCFAAQTTRLRELLAADPSLASRPSRGEPPLFAMPDDDGAAAEVVELLLSFGAEASVKNAAGLTPAEVVRKSGLEETAELLANP